MSVYLLTYDHVTTALSYLHWLPVQYRSPINSVQDLPVWFQYNNLQQQLLLTTTTIQLQIPELTLSLSTTSQPLSQIPTICSSRRKTWLQHRKSTAPARDCVLIPVSLTLLNNAPQKQLPKMCVLNATSLAKPTGLQKLYCDLNNFNIDVYCLCHYSY